MKFLWILALIVLGLRLFLGRWPWQLGAAGRKATVAGTARARALLGVAEGARREEIIEAHKRLVAMVHPDKGGTNEQVHEANDARDLLLGALSIGNPSHP